MTPTNRKHLSGLPHFSSRRPGASSALNSLVAAVLVCLFVSLGAFLGLFGADARAQEEVKPEAKAESPKQAVFDLDLVAFENRKGHVVLQLRHVAGSKTILSGLPKNMRPDKRDFLKNLGKGEGPFDIEEGPQRATAYWRDFYRLEINTGLTASQWFNYLQNGGVLRLAWDKRLKPFVKLERHDFDFGNMLSYYAFQMVNRSNNEGQRVTLVSARSFAFDYRFYRAGDDLELSFRFNRPMAEGDDLKNPLPREAWPLTFSEDLEVLGKWLDQNTFSIYTSGLSDEEYQQKVIGQTFSFGFRPGLASLRGETPRAFSSGPVVLDPFRVLDFSQAGYDEDGNVRLELFFNKAVSLPDLKKALNFHLVSGSEGEIRTPFEQAVLDEVGRPGAGATQGLEARLHAPLESGQRLRLSLDSLPSADGLSKMTDVRSDLMIRNYFGVEETTIGFDAQPPFKPHLRVEFTDYVSELGGLEKFVTLDPPVPFELSVRGYQLVISSSFSHGQPVNVKILKGLPSAGSDVLERDFIFTVKLADEMTPRAAFTGEGRYMTGKLPPLIKIVGREADSLGVKVWRVYEDNLPAILNIGQENSPLVAASTARLFSELLIDREATLTRGAGSDPAAVAAAAAGAAAATPAAPGGAGAAADAADASASARAAAEAEEDYREEAFERLIDLKDLLGQEALRPGAYILEATPWVKEIGGRKYTSVGSVKTYDESDETYDENKIYANPEQYLPVVITDLGLSARVLPEAVSVWVLSLADAKPAVGATIRLYDKANQILAEGESGADGLYRAEVKGDVSFLTAKLGDDLSYLVLNEKDYPLTGDYVSSHNKTLSGYGGPREAHVPENFAAPFLRSGYEGFIILPRDIFKPGEIMEAQALVRDKNLNPPAESFPLLWRLVNPEGRVTEEIRGDLSAAGGLALKTEIPFSAPTGVWTLEARLPGAKAALAISSFVVKDFVPPRLELTMTPTEKIVTGTSIEAGLQAQARYLFGAAGSGLEWALKVQGFADEFTSELYKDYVFGVDANLTEFERVLDERTGQLDDEGLLNYSLTLRGDPAELPSNLILAFGWEVMEDGGRWVGQHMNMSWRPREIMLGLRLPPHLTAGTKADFDLVALDGQGALADLKEVETEISLVLPRRYATVRHGRLRSQNAEELKPVFSKKVALTKGEGRATLPALDSGQYEFVAKGPGGEALRRRFQVGLSSSTVVSAPASLDMPLTIKLDQNAYNRGDKALATIETPFDGPVWATLETDKELFSAVGQAVGGRLELSFDVPEGILQNAFLTAAAVRPLSADTYGWLAFGRLSLEMDRRPHQLAVEATMDERIFPSSKTKVTVSLKDEQGRPTAGEATIALVDEGILSLTSFKVPQPLKFFGRSRAPLGLAFDLYSLLLPPEEPLLPFLAAGGGDEGGRSDLFSPFKRDQVLLSLFLASVAVDESGQAEVELDIPEYSGQARLAVVAASRDKFGQTSSSVRVARDLTIEPTLPLALAPGDKVVGTVRVFLDALAPAGSTPEIETRTEGPVRIEKVVSSSGETVDLPLKPALTPGQGETYSVWLIAEPEAAPAGQAGDRSVSGSASGAQVDRAGPAALLLTSESNGLVFTQKAGTVVRPPFPWFSRTEGGLLTSAETTIAIDYSGFLPGTAKASLALASGQAAEAARAASFLLRYPYGCLEQTVSQAWAHLAALDFGSFLGVSSVQESENALLDAVKRLSTMQTFQGGFGLWPGDRDIYYWGTAYAVHFLLEASRRVELPPGLLEDSIGFLRTRVNPNSSALNRFAAEEAVSVRAYALYVLSLAGEKPYNWLNYLKERSRAMGGSIDIFMAASEALMEGTPKALLELDAAQKSEEFFENVYSLESPSRNRALQLAAWTGVDPLNPRTAELAAEVAADGRENLWRTTQENGMAILALSSYMRKTAATEPYEAILADSQGRELARGSQEDPAGLASSVLAELPDDQVKISLTGQGRPWFNLTVGGVPIEPPKPTANKMHLSKTWSLAGSDGFELELEHLTPGAEAARVVKGRIVEVTLTVYSDEATENVVVADLLPGGFEVVGNVMSEEVQEENNDDDYDYYYEDEASLNARAVHLEAREDRVIAVIPKLDNSPTTLRYSMRAVSVGNFVLPPTTAEGMYNPERQVVLPTGKVTVAAFPVKQSMGDASAEAAASGEDD
ncbi:MAG: hypothetical protein LBJ64_09210 [Deltaproteobacteria bacterium]|jgi:uncharacterized protein YfaS (alpha-2-macroglobulin family)|nr:hypothetical protein [Deltaproteobacteria bacterium]